VTEPLIFTPGPAQHAFYAVAVAWLVFEGVMRTVQRLRAGHRTLLSLQDPSTVVIGGALAGSVALSQLLGRRGGLLWPGGRLWPVIVGIALIVLGAGIRAWAIGSLGRFFQYQIEIQPGHRVVTRGPYRFVRHPSYTGITLAILGFAVGCGDVYCLLATVVLIAIGLAVRIRAEERQLTEALGAEYREFAAHRKRLIPGVW
jgi:protein-S-isoprenylcysteine O-methyltransferase Ste14